MDACIYASIVHISVEMGWKKKLLGLLKKRFLQSFVWFFMFIGRSLSLLQVPMCWIYVSFMHTKERPTEIV